MKKIFFILLLSLGFSLSSNAQYNSFWSLNWQMSQGYGDTKDFIEDFSTYGGEIEGKYFISPAIAIGGKLAWNNLFELKPHDTYQVNENTHITSVQRRYISTTPLMITASYFPLEYDRENHLFPFISIGTGIVWASQEIHNGIFYNDKNRTTWGINPEVGVIFKTGYNVGINFKAGYTYASFDGLNGYSDGKLPGLTNISMFNYSIGFTWMY
jgi:hypothetical protein